MPSVDIVIVNWNGRRYLPACLDALARQTHKEMTIWLVDNGSTDDSVDYVQQHHPQVRLLRNADNRGFSAANNQAIRAGVASYVVTLNNDTQPEPDFIATLMDALEQHPHAGMAASKMLFAQNPSTINSAGIAVDRLGIAWDRCGGAADNETSTDTQFIFGACAGAAMYRRAMLDDVGLFVEDFFAYLEDVDLAWRAQWAGWQALYVPAARVRHHHSATAGEGSPFKSRLLGRNKLWLIARNYPTPQLWWYLPLIALYDIAAVVYAAVARRDLYALRGRLDGLRGLRHAWQQRRDLLHRVSSADVMALLQPIELPWRVMRRYRHLRIL
jgi:GT2 family glycosyltransferase